MTPQCDNRDCDEPADVPCTECGKVYCYAHAGHPEHTGPNTHSGDAPADSTAPRDPT
jgi:hypothetical protein